MSRWFRHYAGMMRDDKLVRVALRSKQSVERVLWVWGAILESAAEIDDNGRYDLAADEAAYFLRADETDISSIIVALTEAGRLDSNGVVHWGNRQFSSDKSKDRQAAYRQRQKEAEQAGRSDCDGSEGGGDGGVTSPSRHGDAPETETETETEVSSSKDDSRSDDQPSLRPEHVFEFYQELAGQLGQPIPRDLTPERRQLVKGRISQYALGDFHDVFARCRGSPFLRGDRGRTPLSFDWLMKKGNFQKVLEGNYDR